jgi:hypothetical protein
MIDTTMVRVRLLCDDPQPPHPDGSAFRFACRTKPAGSTKGSLALTA